MQTGWELRGAALAARCKQVVREAGTGPRLPVRRVHEPFPAYGRRVARATARIAGVYRTLHAHLEDLPGAFRVLADGDLVNDWANVLDI